MKAKDSTSRGRHLCAVRASAPPMTASACRRCAAVSATSKSASPSTSPNATRPLANARRVNSPGSASRRPGSASSQPAIARVTARLP